MIVYTNWVRKLLRNLITSPLSQYLDVERMLKKWLTLSEEHYGGFVKTRRGKISPKDPRPHDMLKTIGMQGGDRMGFHGYAAKYAQYLVPIVKNYSLNDYPIVIVEVGILKGTGLAIWGDLFPRGRLIGFDIDPSFIKQNMSFLKKSGAFKVRKPEIYEFDEYFDNSRLIQSILGGEKISICIDDGTHATKANLTTFKSMKPHLSKEFVYFIEDNPDVHKEIRKRYPHLRVENVGELTIITSI